MIKLLGIIIIVFGFALKLDTIAVVLIAGLVTGLLAHINPLEIFNILGKAFVESRYISLFLLTLAIVGILERNGLRERASFVITQIKGATSGRILSLYVILRVVLSALSIRISGHIQFIRPLIYPMVKAAGEKTHLLSPKQDEKTKAICNAVDNYGNFFGQNIFIASPGVLLIAKSLQDAGIQVDAYSIALASIPAAFFIIIYSLIQNSLLDKTLKKDQK